MLRYDDHDKYRTWGRFQEGDAHRDYGPAYGSPYRHHCRQGKVHKEDSLDVDRELWLLDNPFLSDEEKPSYFDQLYRLMRVRKNEGKKRRTSNSRKNTRL
jgi:hypothetical protein